MLACFIEQYGGLDPNVTGLLNQEEHFSEIFKEYEQKCRVWARLCVFGGYFVWSE